MCSLLLYQYSTQDNTHALQRQMEITKQENKRLFVQKKELITGFQKQMKLIDLYKRQKVYCV